MDNESKLIVELWEYFRDMLPAGRRQEAATHLLRLFQEYGFQVESSELEGECEHLDHAVESFLEPEDDHSDLDYNDYDDRD